MLSSPRSPLCPRPMGKPTKFHCVRKLLTCICRVNPYWKLALVFKCLTDMIILDDFKTCLDKLRGKLVQGSHMNSMGDTNGNHSGKEFTFNKERQGTITSQTAPNPAAISSGGRRVSKPKLELESIANNSTSPLTSARPSAALDSISPRFKLSINIALTCTRQGTATRPLIATSSTSRPTSASTNSSTASPGPGLLRSHPSPWSPCGQPRMETATTPMARPTPPAHTTTSPRWTHTTPGAPHLITCLPSTKRPLRHQAARRLRSTAATLRVKHHMLSKAITTHTSCKIR